MSSALIPCGDPAVRCKTRLPPLIEVGGISHLIYEKAAGTGCVQPDLRPTQRTISCLSFVEDHSAVSVVVVFLRLRLAGSLTFSRCQMSRTYSSMVRSEENLPTQAVFMIAICAQRF